MKNNIKKELILNKKLLEISNKKLKEREVIEKRKKEVKEERCNKKKYLFIIIFIYILINFPFI